MSYELNPPRKDPQTAQRYAQRSLLLRRAPLLFAGTHCQALCWANPINTSGARLNSPAHTSENKQNEQQDLAPIDIFLFASPWPGKSCNVVNPLTDLPFGDDFSTHQNEKSLEMVYGIGFTMIYPLVI